MEKVYRVAVNTPFNNSILTYTSEVPVQRGDLVWVPLGRRKEKGCVLEEVSEDIDQKFEVKK